jgi:hypothetical protein
MTLGKQLEFMTKALRRSLLFLQPSLQRRRPQSNQTIWQSARTNGVLENGWHAGSS